MNINTNTKSSLSLPYNIIEVSSSDEHFVFQCTQFNENRRKSYAGGEFGIIYNSRHLNCNFPCDVTIENVYDFYTSLDYAYDIMYGKNSTAALENIGTERRTSLMFNFDGKGCCTVNGLFLNKSTGFRNGISFSFEAEPSDIPDILNSMERFFNEIRRIQGH